MNAVAGMWQRILDMENASLVGLAGAVLVLVLLTHVALRWWLRRSAYARDDAREPFPGQPVAARWVRRSVRALAPPLAFLIWVHGIRFAGVLLLSATAPPTSIAGVAGNAISWTYRFAVLAAIVWCLARVGQLVEAFLIELSARAQTGWDDLLLPHAGRAARYGLPLLAVILAAPTLSLSQALSDIVQRGSSLLLIGFVAFVLFQIVDAAASFIVARHRIDVSDNLQARAIYTQVVVLKKVAVTVIAVFTVASMLMVFESVRQFGASILASAGVAGIVVGFAAQRSIATLLAGFQIALTQPIRVDDVVIVEGEWGRIEDITLTYVVVRIWDLRRLVVPITFFIEQPFENWTRNSSDLLCTVLLYLDYTVPVDALRAELTSILTASPLWDGKTNVLQVTNAKDHTLEVRALASAANASQAFDLRCDIRERLVSFVQRHYPESLPRFRASLDSTPAGAGFQTPERAAAP